LSYKERLDRLGLLSPGALGVYKIMRGMDKVVNIFSQNVEMPAFGLGMGAR